MPEILSKVTPEHRIAAGMDSMVYWPKGNSHVYKVFPPHYTSEMLGTYVSFVSNLVKEGVAFLGMLYDDQGCAYRITVSANHQEHHTTLPNKEQVVMSPYIPGPTIYSIMMSFEGGRYLDECLAQINTVPDEAESARLHNLHARFCTREGHELFYGLTDYYHYSPGVAAWIAQHLPTRWADAYTLPGEMNVKVRMPADDEIHFIVTDLFGDYRKHYTRVHQREA